MAQTKQIMAKDSLKRLGVSFAASTQPRSEQALKNLIEAAARLVDVGDTTQFNARSLSKLSGYSLGALVQRLGKIENIFLHAIAYQRTQLLKDVTELIDATGPNLTAEECAKIMVSFAFDNMKPLIMRYYESRALGRTQNVDDIYAYTDEIVPAMLKVIERNTTGTFRKITPYEAKYVARAAFVFLERPFVESDPFAGTDLHRKMAIEQISALLRKVP